MELIETQPVSRSFDRLAKIGRREIIDDGRRARRYDSAAYVRPRPGLIPQQWLGEPGHPGVAAMSTPQPWSRQTYDRDGDGAGELMSARCPPDHKYRLYRRD